jgi:hypothetical protein
MASRRNAEDRQNDKADRKRGRQNRDNHPQDLARRVVPRRIPEYLDYSRTENGLDVYRDLSTGKEVFIPEQPKK